jgi:hypothetical protein
MSTRALMSWRLRTSLPAEILYRIQVYAPDSTAPLCPRTDALLSLPLFH